MLVIAASCVVVVTIFASFLLSTALRLSVKREAPQIYENLWRPTNGAPVIRLKMALPFAKMIYLRQYRSVFADYPKSRAWASWMFANNWIQLIALVTMALLTLNK